MHLDKLLKPKHNDSTFKGKFRIQNCYYILSNMHNFNNNKSYGTCQETGKCNPHQQKKKH